MDLSKHFILLNGKPKTLQIDTIQWNGSNGYSVRFKNSVRTYNYGCDKVVWLGNPEWKDPTQCKVLVDGILQNGIREIWRFDNIGYACWRVIYNNGFVQDDASGRIVVAQSCLQETASMDVFEVGFLNLPRRASPQTIIAAKSTGASPLARSP